ncbi:Transmembrane emp24 domain-containing protein 6 [Gracilariopsis chorda]|uniref:Transmembrane emp24 domain-containing protein 6 n=1 Tax=Gracilariopsis chorda TaxID=448386 RepID=A0A2V3J6B7_9FLOR|nr:Transmembrane emp24 domain-containing protein 6 [Gracilariopsis chorda]|eukprot:PXF49537.1 Transmembrane emp24 domain-containing protein 6 [Gracilariopsis chorda]
MFPFFAFLLVLILTNAPVVRAFGIQIPPGGMEHCFFREVHVNDHVYVHYVARETINISVKDGNERILYQKKSVVQGSFDFAAQEDGSYRICLSVELMRRKPTIAKFRFLVVDPSVLGDKVATSGQAHKANHLSNKVKSLSDQVLFRTHLYSDTAYETDETLKSSVTLAARMVALECVAALLAAISQVSYIRKVLFASRSRRQRMV